MGSINRVCFGLHGKVLQHLTPPSFVIGSSCRRRELNIDMSDVTKSSDHKSKSGSVALRKGTGGRSSFNGQVVTVFGASGYVGHSVVNNLGKIGSQVIIPYRGDHYNVRHLKVCGDLGQVLFFPYYLRDEESVYKAMKYSNVVINLVGKDNETASFLYDEVHVEGARTIAKMAREAGVQRLIHVSALNCSPQPQGQIITGGSRFLKSKYFGELAVREEFPSATIIRPADVFGFNDRFLTYYCHFWRRSLSYTMVWGCGKGVFKQPVYHSDLGRGIVNAVFDDEAVGKTYDAIGPKRYELAEIVEYIMRITHRDADEGFGMKDMKYHPLFWMKVKLTELYRKDPPKGLCWDKIEREMVTDEITPENPTLKDLGIILTPLEKIAKFALKQERKLNYYDDAVGEWEEPCDPKTVPPF